MKSQPTPDIHRFLNDVHCGDAAELMAEMPSGSVDFIVTSPPYWTAVKYDFTDEQAPICGGNGTRWKSYEDYLQDMFRIWRECARVLRPNGKLAINAPLMPIPKDIVHQHTRHLKNISADMEQMILGRTDLSRYGLFVWQKQTSKMMFGSYPYPGNIIENNTIEFITVYIKPGKPPKFSADVKEANKVTREEWLDLTQQVWFMYPEDVKRGGDHPAPFPEKLPGRLLRMYTYGAFRDFPGEIVLDPFVGTGTTCVVAKSMGRRYIGMDVVPRYVKLARDRVKHSAPFQPLLLVGRAKYPTRDELIDLLAQGAGSAGRAAESKHKRKTYGRGARAKANTQLDLI